MENKKDMLSTVWNGMHWYEKYKLSDADVDLE